MGLVGVFERVGLVDLDLHRATQHDIEQVAGHFFVPGPVRGVGEQGRSGDIDRALGAEDRRVDRLDGVGGVAEGRQGDERRGARVRERPRRAPGQDCGSETSR